MKQTYFFLGVACQAFITSSALLLGFPSVSIGQQLVTGFIFLAISAGWYLWQRRKELQHDGLTRRSTRPLRVSAITVTPRAAR
jgi:hypothetical protein